MHLALKLQTRNHRSLHTFRARIGRRRVQQWRWRRRRRSLARICILVSTVSLSDLLYVAFPHRALRKNLDQIKKCDIISLFGSRVTLILFLDVNLPYIAVWSILRFPQTLAVHCFSYLIDNIYYVNIDRWPPYMIAVETWVPPLKSGKNQR